MQLVREAICFLGIAGLAKGERGLVERARSDGWVVVEQRDALKCFAGVIEVSTLQLHFACKQARFGVYAGKLQTARLDYSEFMHRKRVTIVASRPNSAVTAKTGATTAKPFGKLRHE